MRRGLATGCAALLVLLTAAVGSAQAAAKLVLTEPKNGGIEVPTGTASLIQINFNDECVKFVEGIPLTVNSGPLDFFEGAHKEGGHCGPEGSIRRVQGAVAKVQLGAGGKGTIFIATSPTPEIVENSACHYHFTKMSGAFHPPSVELVGFAKGTLIKGSGESCPAAEEVEFRARFGRELSPTEVELFQAKRIA